MKLTKIFCGLGIMALCSCSSATSNQADQAAETATEQADSTLSVRDKVMLDSVDALAGIQRTDDGLRYIAHQEGTGAKPTMQSTVCVAYRGTFADGTEFDADTCATFPVSGLINGFAEGLTLMREGAVYTYYIPSALAYGKKGYPGAIGPDEPLIFEVTLKEVKAAQ
jgi:FKBP-type peptidyl-prolyl cis-trans isomerase